MHNRFKYSLRAEDELYIEQVMQYINPIESRKASIFPIMKHILKPDEEEDDEGPKEREKHKFKVAYLSAPGEAPVGSFEIDVDTLLKEVFDVITSSYLMEIMEAIFPMIINKQMS